MKLSYNRELNIAYLRLREQTAEVETIEVNPDLNIDIAPDGQLYGLEFLNANDQLFGSNGKVFELVDEEHGQRQEFALELK